MINHLLFQESFHSFPVTGLTYAPQSGLSAMNEKASRLKRMAVLALLQTAVVVAVFHVRRGAKVVWVYASSIAALVMNFFSRRDGSDEKLVGPAVRLRPFMSGLEKARVPQTVDSSCPIPAACVVIHLDHSSEPLNRRANQRFQPAHLCNEKTPTRRLKVKWAHEGPNQEASRQNEVSCFEALQRRVECGSGYGACQ